MSFAAARKPASGANAPATCCSRPRSSTKPIFDSLKRERVVWQNRAQFYCVAAQMMRRILVDHARARNDGEALGAVGACIAR